MSSWHRKGATNLAVAVSLAAVLAALAVTRGQRILSTRAAAAALPEASSSDPNVVLISIDTGRAFNMSVYGYERATTPWLDSIGSRGVVFDAAVAPAPWTLPSHASMLTGRWASELSTDYVKPLDETFPTLAEYLSQRGYRTLGIVANLRYTGYETGLDRGFSEYVDYPVSAAQLASSLRVGRRVLNHPRLRVLIRNDQHLVRLSAAEISERALSRISDDAERPVFLFLNYFDLHEPYLPPEPFDRRFGAGRARGRISPLHRWLYDRSVGHAPMSVEEVQEEIDAYDGSIAYLDSQLRSFVSSLESRFRRPTLLIITSDHGEEFGEHRVFDHGNSLYYPSVRVPLVVAGLDEIPRGVRVSAPVSTRSIPRTVASLLGSDGQPFPGTSLELRWEEERSEGGPVFSEVQHATGHPDWFPVSKGDMASVRLGPHRYILNGDGTEELYDLERDVWESANLADEAEHQALLGRLREMVTDHGASSSGRRDEEP